MRNVLVTALVACADRRQRGQSLQFLQGLSGDELQYIAEFLGACILDAGGATACTRSGLAARVAGFGQMRARELPPAALCDQEHKTILLLEYLCRSGMRLPRTPRPA